MSKPATIILAGGGTGGHLYPGIAVAEALRTILPDAQSRFLCTVREIDRVILDPTGFEFIPQPIVPPKTRRCFEILPHLSRHARFGEPRSGPTQTGGRGGPGRLRRRHRGQIRR